MTSLTFEVADPATFTPFVRERFTLSRDTKKSLQAREPDFGFNGFGELTFYRTYSRAKYEYAVCPIVDEHPVNESLLGDPISPKTRSWLQCKAWLAQARREQPGTKWDTSERQVGQETWADCVTRVIEGVMSIRKDHYAKNHIKWSDRKWQPFARELAISLFDMKWMPPGRGLWAMGTEFVFERGALALQNCGFTRLGNELGDDLHWLMDALMCGVGVGMGPERTGLKLVGPKGKVDYRVKDSREGWCDLIRDTVNAWIHGLPLPVPDFVDVRPAGSPIRGFGGVSSGPGPLKSLYQQVNKFCWWYLEGFIGDEHLIWDGDGVSSGSKLVKLGLTDTPYDEVMFKADLANCVGCCVVAGNVRRSAELACAPISDPVFLDLKDYAKYPYREAHGWMSNNSVALEKPEDFDLLGEIAKRVIANGEPGYINRRNMKHGRIGKFDDVALYKIREDKAIGFNPCAEQPQEDKESCNLAETCPTRCDTPEEWLTACEYATFYASTVSLLLTHRAETNAVIVRNRRIGVSIIDFVGFKARYGVAGLTRHLRDGYKTIRRVNRELADEAGVVDSIRVTTVKPGGTTPKLAGRNPGMSHPNFEYMIRRIRIAKNSPVHPILVAAGVPHEADRAELAAQGVNLTDVFEFPLHTDGKPSLQVSLWEQAMNLVLLQREWSDNAVSNTLNFRPKWHTITKVKGQVEQVTLPDGRLVNVDDLPETGLEMGDYRVIKVRQWGESGVHVQKFDPRNEEGEIEAVLSSIAPLTKSVALLPQSPVGAYDQMPEEGIDEAEYDRRRTAIGHIDWSSFTGSDGEDERYCTGASCTLAAR